jgi:hypothetical protein
MDQTCWQEYAMGAIRVSTVLFICERDNYRCRRWVWKGMVLQNQPLISLAVVVAKTSSSLYWLTLFFYDVFHIVGNGSAPKYIDHTLRSRSFEQSQESICYVIQYERQNPQQAAIRRRHDTMIDNTCVSWT